MEPITPLDDLDIQRKVESLAGIGTVVVDCEKSSWFVQDQILLVNGDPIPIRADEGERIKEFVQSGQGIPLELLAQILRRAGIGGCTEEEIELGSVESSWVTKTEESVTLRDNLGRILDGTECVVEDRFKRITLSSSESGVGDFGEGIKSLCPGRTRGMWKEQRRRDLGSHGSSSSCSSSIESDQLSPSSSSFSSSSSFLSPSSSPNLSTSTDDSSSGSRDSPSIFGTVAASSPSTAESPYHRSTSHQRKTLPQTPITGSGFSTGGLIGESQQLHHHSTTPQDRLSSLSSESSASSASSTDDNKAPTPENVIPSIIKATCDWDNALVYQDTNLVSGTLDALIQHLVPTQSYYPDRAYVFAFLLSSRLYIKPHELLGRVFRLAVATTQHSSKIHTAKEMKIISHVVQLLGEWAELFPYDFRDERMMGHVRSITQKCIAVNPTIRQDVSQLLTSLLSRLTALERYENFLQRINTEAALGEPITAPSILTICSNPTMLAQQLTHIELDRLSHIGPEEFVQAFAKENSQVETKYKDMKKTRNLESYVQWFNRLSYFVATEICKMPKRKSRVRVIEYWIEAAKECFNIGNFNSLMAIIAGLNMSPVSRLKKTWHKVSSAQLSILEHQMDPSSNFSSYRSTLKAAVWRSAGTADERHRIVIPFFSLLVKDLYFLNEACASKLPSGHINVDKFWQLAKQVTEVIAWQQITCPYSKAVQLINCLQTVPIFNETALCLSSYECEAADNPQEKERLKYLRNEGNNKKLISTSTDEKEDLKK